MDKKTTLAAARPTEVPGNEKKSAGSTVRPTEVSGNDQTSNSSDEEPWVPADNAWWWQIPERSDDSPILETVHTPLGVALKFVKKTAAASEKPPSSTPINSYYTFSTVGDTTLERIANYKKILLKSPIVKKGENDAATPRGIKDIYFFCIDLRKGCFAVRKTKEDEEEFDPINYYAGLLTDIQEIDYRRYRALAFNAHWIIPEIFHADIRYKNDREVISLSPFLRLLDYWLIEEK